MSFTREEWKVLRAATPLTIRQKDLEAARGTIDRIDLDEVADVYLPLTRLLNLYVAATQNLHRVSAAFLGTISPKVPYVIGVGGSVAVGKSTFARILQALLSRWPDHPKVDLVTTDGFLYPNAVLNGRRIMNRKGFPESYDNRRLLTFLRDVKSGDTEVRAPIYSHVIYDIVPDSELIVRQPDILILEGLNVLQGGSDAPRVRQRLLRLLDLHRRRGGRHRGVVRRAFPRSCARPSSRTRSRSSATSPISATTTRWPPPASIWKEINGKNLVENILPTRYRANLVLHKSSHHRVDEVQLRKL